DNESDHRSDHEKTDEDPIVHNSSVRRLARILCPLHAKSYSPSFGSTVAAAVSSADAATYVGNSVTVAGTYFSTMSRVSKTPSFSMRNSNFAPSASMIGCLLAGGSSHIRRLNGPSAFLRVL